MDVLSAVSSDDIPVEGRGTADHGAGRERRDSLASPEGDAATHVGADVVADDAVIASGDDADAGRIPGDDEPRTVLGPARSVNTSEEALPRTSTIGAASHPGCVVPSITIGSVTSGSGDDGSTWIVYGGSGSANATVSGPGFAFAARIASPRLQSEAPPQTPSVVPSVVSTLYVTPTAALAPLETARARSPAAIAAWKRALARLPDSPPSRTSSVRRRSPIGVS